LKFETKFFFVCLNDFRGLEANQFSGTIPKELGNLVNLEGL